MQENIERYDHNPENRASQIGSINVHDSAHVIVGDVHITQAAQKLAVEDVTRQVKNAFLKSLSFPEQHDRYHGIEAGLVGTCKWFLHNELYHAWQSEGNADSHSWLWLRGKPGTGKSTLLKAAIDDTREQTLLQDNRPFIATFFFNARGVRLETTAEGCYRSLVHQIFEITELDLRSEPLQSYLNKRDTVQDGWAWTEPQLKSLLQVALDRMSKMQPITIFVDALDECNPNQIRPLITFLNTEICRIRATGAAIKICVSSRHYPNIALPTCHILTTEAHNGNDIRKYVDSHILDGLSSSYDFEARHRLWSFAYQIAEKSSGIFLWTRLITEQVRQAIEDGEPDATMEFIFSAMPRDLEEIFDKLWRSLTTFELDRSRALIIFVMFELEQLTPDQLILLLAFRKPWKSMSEYLRSDQFVAPSQYSRLITKSARGLVEILFDRNIQLIHGTVREYFLDHPDSLIPSVTTAEDLKAKANDMIARACFNFAAADFPRAFTAQRKLLQTNHPLARYVANKAFEHASIAETSGLPQTYILDCLNVKGSDPWDWRRLLSEWHSQSRRTFMGLVFEHQLISVMENLPEIHGAPPHFARYIIGESHLKVFGPGQKIYDTLVGKGWVIGTVHTHPPRPPVQLTEDSSQKSSRAGRRSAFFDELTVPQRTDIDYEKVRVFKEKSRKAVDSGI